MRPLILLTLLATLALPACTSQKQLNAEKSQSIESKTDAITQSSPRISSIPVQVGTLYHGKLDVYGDLQSPPRLQLTLALPDNGKLVNNYYFLDGLLARATTERFPENKQVVPTAGTTTFYGPQSPFYTNDVFFYQDQIIGRHTTGDPGNTARIEPEFPDRSLIDQLRSSTRSSSIFIDPVPSAAGNPPYPMD